MPAFCRVQWKQIPYEHCRPMDILRNLFWCRRHCGKLIHITGDVHYCALGMSSGSRIVLAVHDLIMLRRAKGWRRWLFLKLWFDWPIRRCAIVTCISENTRTELLAIKICPPEKVVVIPDPVGPEFQACLKEFNPDHPRILHFNMTANKNLATTIKAIRDLRCHLRIIGRLTGEQKQMLCENQIDHSCVFNISDQEILEEYRQCDLLCFPSTYEGFGMPIVEAQAVGRPAITSDMTPMSDTVGSGGACLIDPQDSSSIRAGLERVLSGYS